LSGETKEALKLANSLYGDVLQNHSTAWFMLQCQYFIEMIKKGTIDEAVEFAQTVLSHYKNLGKKEDTFLQSVLGLLAYSDPFNSPLCYLLYLQQRETVADSVNRAILSVEKNTSSYSTLERLLKQLVATQMAIREEADNKGEVPTFKWCLEWVNSSK